MANRRRNTLLPLLVMGATVALTSYRSEDDTPKNEAKKQLADKIKKLEKDKEGVWDAICGKLGEYEVKKHDAIIGELTKHYQSSFNKDALPIFFSKDELAKKLENKLHSEMLELDVNKLLTEGERTKLVENVIGVLKEPITKLRNERKDRIEALIDLNETDLNDDGLSEDMKANEKAIYLPLVECLLLEPIFRQEALLRAVLKHISEKDATQ